MFSPPLSFPTLPFTPTVQSISLLKIVWKLTNHFAREVIVKGHFFSFCSAEGRDPGCPLGTPKNLGFPRVPGPDFRVWAPSHTLSSVHFWVGLESPKIMVFQAHPGLRIMECIYIYIYVYLNSSYFFLKSLVGSYSPKLPILWAFYPTP